MSVYFYLHRNVIQVGDVMDSTEVELFILKTAINKGWKLQPDQNKYKSLIKSMAKKADGNTIICPCKVYVKGMVDISEVCCPCKESDEAVRVEGSCHCNMFFKWVV